MPGRVLAWVLKISTHVLGNQEPTNANTPRKIHILEPKVMKVCKIWKMTFLCISGSGKPAVSFLRRYKNYKNSRYLEMEVVLQKEKAFLHLKRWYPQGEVIFNPSFSGSI